MKNLKSTFYEDKEMQDIKKKYYSTKGNLIISILILIEHNCIFSQLSSVQKGEMLVEHPASGASKSHSQ